MSFKSGEPLIYCVQCSFSSLSQEKVLAHIKRHHELGVGDIKFLSTSDSENMDPAASHSPLTSNTVADEKGIEFIDQQPKAESSILSSEVGTVNCFLCSYQDVSPPRVKSHIFAEHPTTSAVALRIDGSQRDITFFCVKETCDYSTSVCSDYEKHLMSCLGIKEIHSNELEERLNSSIVFVLDFYTRHGQESSLEFKDFVSNFNDVYNKSGDSGSPSLSGLMKEKQSDAQELNSCTPVSQDINEIKSEYSNICLDQVSSSKNDRERDEVLDTNGQPDFTVNVNENKEDVIASLLGDHLISGNSASGENALAGGSSFNTYSDFSSRETNVHIKTEVLNDSEMDTIVQNAVWPPTPGKSIGKTKKRQKKYTVIGKRKSSSTAGPSRVKSKPPNSRADSNRSVGCRNDLDLIQKETPCWDCFRKSVFCLDFEFETLTSSAVELRTRNLFEAMTRNDLGVNDIKRETFEKDSPSRPGRRRLTVPKVECEDSSGTSRHPGYGRNSVTIAVSDEGDKIATTSELDQESTCWLCFQSFSHSYDMRKHVLEDHSETFDGLKEDFCNRPQFILFCPNRCDYTSLNEEELNRHVVVCKEQGLTREEQDVLSIYNFLSQQYMRLKHNLSPLLANLGD